MIHTRALLDDPRHKTHRQGSAVLALLDDGLAAVDRQLAAARSAVYDATEDSAGLSASRLEMAVAGLLQVHVHLHLLGARWPLGTADLFVRKLAAEGLRLPVPALCPSDDPGGDEVGTELRKRLNACGLAPTMTSARPIVRIATVDLVDPLAWPAVLYPLASWAVSRGELGALLPDVEMNGDILLRLCTAAVTARILGEPTFAALAVKDLLCSSSGTARNRDLLLVAAAMRPYAQADPIAGYGSQLEYFTAALGGAGRGRKRMVLACGGQCAEHRGTGLA